MDPRIEQLNAAGTALNTAVENVRTANDADMPAAEQTFRDAQAEFERCRHNADVATEASQLQRFTAVPVANPNDIGMDPTQVRAYSMVRAINAAATGDWRGAEMEREASEEIAKRTGKTARGFFVPADVQSEQRALGAGTPTAGGNFVATNLLASSMIELKRNRMVVRQAGATVLGGLVGNIAIPRQTGGGTFYWVGSDTAPATSQPAVDQVLMSPKVGGTYTDIGRSLLVQSSVDVENMVRTDLATISALGIDAAALNGLGSANQPKGVAGQLGVYSVAGGTNGLVPTFANIVDLETGVAVANADMGALAYITNAKVRGKLKTTPKVAAYPEFIWEDGGTLNGYQTFVSNQVPSNLTKGTATGICSQIFFGNWNDLVIGEWGTLDLMVDPYTGSTSGTVRVVVLQDLDIAVRHAESFGLMADALTA